MLNYLQQDTHENTVGNQFKHSMLSLLAESNNLNQRTLFYVKKKNQEQINLLLLICLFH